MFILTGFQERTPLHIVQRLHKFGFYLSKLFNGYVVEKLRVGCESHNHGFFFLFQESDGNHGRSVGLSLRELLLSSSKVILLEPFLLLLLVWQLIV